MIKKISKQTKEEILEKVKKEEEIKDLAFQYTISVKTIYNWLRVQIKPDISLMQWSKIWESEV